MHDMSITRADGQRLTRLGTSSLHEHIQEKQTSF